MKRFLFLLPVLGVLAVAVALAPLASRADDDDDDDDDDRPAAPQRGQPRHQGREGHEGREGGGGRGTAVARTDPGWAGYQAECGSCHLAYPPGMLPPASWQKLLTGLDAHFGQNAEVDAATRARLGSFLARFAGPADGQAPLRITELSWWRREHDELSPGVYARKTIGTPANCGACHARAEQGDFDEHGVRVPTDPARPAGTR